jgi:autonomous glycyl radical cofactor GrcA
LWRAHKYRKTIKKNVLEEFETILHEVEGHIAFASWVSSHRTCSVIPSLVVSNPKLLNDDIRYARAIEKLSAIKEDKIVLSDAVSDVEAHELSMDAETDTNLYNKQGIEVGVGTETFVDSVEDTGIQTSNEEFPPTISTIVSKVACDASVGTSPINVSDYVETDFADSFINITSNPLELIEKKEAELTLTSSSSEALEPREDTTSPTESFSKNDEAEDQDSPKSSSSYDKYEELERIEFPKFSIPKISTIDRVQDPLSKPPKASPREVRISREQAQLQTDESDVSDEIPIRESQQKVVAPESQIARKVISEDLASSTESLVGVDMFKSEEYSSAADSGSDDDVFNHSLEVTSSLESKCDNTFFKTCRDASESCRAYAVKNGAYTNRGSIEKTQRGNCI